MDIFRKIMLAVGCGSFAVCCLFLNLMGGIALISNNYEKCGTSLIISVILLAAALISAFFKNLPANIVSALTNAAGTLFYIYPIAVLNAIPNSEIPKTAVEVLTSRIYPSVAVTVTVAAAVFADIFSYDRTVGREKKKALKLSEKNRPLKDNERII